MSVKIFHISEPKNKIFKYFIWDFDLAQYVPCKFLAYRMALALKMPCFRLPLFGYHSSEHTGF